MAVGSVQNTDWARLAAMMQVAKAKNPALAGGASPASATTSASKAQPAETTRSLPKASSLAMSTYGTKPSQAPTATPVKGAKFDAYA